MEKFTTSLNCKRYWRCKSSESEARPVKAPVRNGLVFLLGHMFYSLSLLCFIAWCKKTAQMRLSCLVVMSDEDSLRLALTGSVQYLPLHLQSDMQMLYHMLHWNTVPETL